ncbi:MAG: hypothetical protein HOP19_08365 [Acidobacteria bacterium]|nr:hypothetical protein [Acidobacteriota bacterium]
MKTFAMMVGLLAMSAVMGLAQGQGNNATRDPLAGLKRAITQASAPVLTATQETAITALITAYRDALPDEADTALETARDAYEAALLAGNQTAANTAADAIAARQAVLSAMRLKASAKLTLDILANLQTGGQLTALNTKFTAERVLQMVRSLAGGGGFGGRD